MSIFSRFFQHKNKHKQKKAAVTIQQPNISAKKVPNEPTPVDHDIEALYSILIDMEGSDRLVLKAGKLNALKLMRSENRNERVLALQKIIYENPTLDKVPADTEIDDLIAEMMEYMANQMARRSLEDQLEKRIAAKMEENHQDYIEDIRQQILKEEVREVDTPQAKAKLAELEAKDKIHLTKSVMELLRPQSLSEIVGQERAIHALKAKLSSPYPQHLLLYGPPGVGKVAPSSLINRVVYGAE